MNATRLFLLLGTVLSVLTNLHADDTDIFKERRKKLAALVGEGIVIVQSTERNQNNLYEFFVPNSDNHDFIFLTGLETAGATLILCPEFDLVTRNPLYRRGFGSYQEKDRHRARLPAG